MFKTLDTFETKFSADSVEWCPCERFRDLFVCGTYEPTPAEPEKAGQIYLFEVSRDAAPSLKLLQQLEVAAVLDMKWFCLGGKALLGVANGVGALQIYELTRDSDSETGPALRLLSEAPVSEESCPATSLDWSTGRQDLSGETRIAVCDSRGTVSLFRLAEDATPERIRSWRAHDFEAWTVAFDYWDANVLYTGGDDNKFLQFDVRVESVNPTNVNRCHNAGVTNIHSNWKKEFCLVSGSYDDALRTWDTRSLRRPLAELDMGGGLWRLKFDPYEGRLLLAACMYRGFALADCADLEAPRLVAEYDEHQSIAYGCDWSRPRPDDPRALVATCSFYDHALKLSDVKIDDLIALPED